ncbi:MmgE/PrpD family protein [uncultured Methanobacterium sp.]|uniref:MmgE/PrpD family protein n=1 Tax=uncultured Methanobacterium sp. TaxID=176306 RepID=UPI002803CC01|nr:MmgE/PrpD family protein [uncultured Methanobacterium sp.]
MITLDIAEFIGTVEYQDLSPKIIEQLKLCFLDFLGVSLRGSRSKSGQIIKDIIPTEGKSTVIGGSTSHPPDAALANGVSAHCLDLDDGHRQAQLHPGACVIPAALSLAESCNKSGREFITSVVVGYEVAISLGKIMNPGHRQKGFHSTGTCGTMGAAVAAAKILDLEEEEILNTLGLAGTQAAGLLESDHTGSMGKHLHAGRAAQSGVLSALLAKKGFTGAHTILEGSEGLFNAMGDFEEKSYSDFKNEIGVLNSRDFEISKVYFKKYPVCRHLHSSLDAILQIMENEKVKIRDIQDITIETYDIAAQHDEYHPQTVEGVRQSLPVSMALAILKGKLNIDDMESTVFPGRDDVDAQKIWELKSKIQIKCDETLNQLYPQKRPSRVTLKSLNHSYHKQVDLAKGEPENPFTKDELLNKFHELNPQVDLEVLDVIDDLENSNLRKLMKSLNFGFQDQ